MLWSKSYIVTTTTTIAQYMPKYAQDMPNLSPKYAKDIFQIYPRYAQKGKGGLSQHCSGAVYSGEYKFCQQRVDERIGASLGILATVAL